MSAMWKPTNVTLAGAGRGKKRQQCESGLVVSLGTERRLSISELSARRTWHCSIKIAGSVALLTLHC